MVSDYSRCGRHSTRVVISRNRDETAQTAFMSHIRPGHSPAIRKVRLGSRTRAARPQRRAWYGGHSAESAFPEPGDIGIGIRDQSGPRRTIAMVLVKPSASSKYYS